MKAHSTSLLLCACLIAIGTDARLSPGYLTVDTIAELEALPPSTATVEVLSYHGPQPYRDELTGGGLFRFDAESTTPIDRGLYFKTATGVGRWVREFNPSEPIRLSWFGAITTAGRLDSNAEMAAINDAAFATAIHSNSFRVVALDRGWHVISKPIILRTNKSLRGSDVARTRDTVIAAAVRHGGFAGDCLLRDYDTFNTSITTGNWDVRNIKFVGSGKVDWAVIATSWNENCGMYGCHLAASNKGGLWVRSNGYAQNYTIAATSIQRGSLATNSFCGIFIDRPQARPSIRNCTIAGGHNPPYDEELLANDVLNSFATNTVRTTGGIINLPAVNTSGMVGIAIGTRGRSNVRIESVHFEKCNIGVAVLGDTAVMVENTDINLFGKKGTLAAIKQGARACTVQSSSGLDVNGPLIFNQNAGALLGKLDGFEADNYIGLYHWSRQSGKTNEVLNYALLNPLGK